MNAVLPPAPLTLVTLIGAVSALSSGVGSTWSSWVTAAGLWIVVPAVPASTIASICNETD